MEVFNFIVNDNERVDLESNRQIKSRTLYHKHNHRRKRIRQRRNVVHLLARAELCH
jgi:hypothetical protein